MRAIDIKTQINYDQSFFMVKRNVCVKYAQFVYVISSVSLNMKQEDNGPHCSPVKQFLSIEKFSRLEFPSPKDTHCDKFG